MTGWERLCQIIYHVTFPDYLTPFKATHSGMSWCDDTKWERSTISSTNYPLLTLRQLGKRNMPASPLPGQLIAQAYELRKCRLNALQTKLVSNCSDALHSIKNQRKRLGSHLKMKTTAARVSKWADISWLMSCRATGKKRQERSPKYWHLSWSKQEIFTLRTGHTEMM